MRKHCNELAAPPAFGRSFRVAGRPRSWVGRLVGAGALASVLLLIGGTGASAHGVNTREHRQRSHIRSGVHDGSLTRGEAHRLRHEQVRIERAERRFRRDGGHLGPRERARLDHLQDRARRDIYRGRHNDRTR